MAKLLYGKQRGRTVTLHQWCNDWVTVKEYVQPFSPSVLEYTEEEIKMILSHKHNGQLLNWYEVYKTPVGSYRFKRVRNGYKQTEKSS